MSYLSIVVAGSNYGYGGDFIGRFQAWMDNIFNLFPRIGVDADITIVEWAPPLDRPRMKDVLNWKRKSIPVKIIEAPKHLADSLPNPHKVSFWEFQAKNIGIRRATGHFILSANPDNIYSPALVYRLRDLKEDCFYRTNHHDTRDGRVFQIHCATASIVNGRPNGCAGFVKPDANGKFQYPPPLGYIEPLHFNKSGDFLAMSRENWHQIHGHPETTYCVTVDGETVYLAAAHGLKQIIFEEPSYHLDHGRDQRHCPYWDDAKPHGNKNGDGWGYSGVDFASTII